LVSNPENGIKLEKIQGKIKFENVTFAYPKDKSRKIFNKINL
jgi:ABC-type multidrug transport system fused ATPase/permease subunit